jgi:tetratricopeptide (TPR) repeat protein
MNRIAHKYYLKAWAAADESDLDSAVRLIDSALGCSPNSPTLLVTKAQFLADVGNNVDAISYALKSTEADKRNYHAWILLGKVYTRLKEFDQAIDSYKNALSLDLDFGTLTLLAIAELEVDPHKAYAHANEALKLKPDWQEAIDTMRAAKRKIHERE